MEKKELRDRLISTLGQLSYTEFFNCAAELFKGKSLVLGFLLTHADSEINPSCISTELKLSRARVTTTLTALRGMGYVAMEMSLNDRRRMLVKITRDGAAYIKKKISRMERCFDTLVQGLGEENAQELLSLIDYSASIMEGQALRI
jgi:DNA-binding MarR family transcriptional regulator